MCAWAPPAKHSLSSQKFESLDFRVIGAGEDITLNQNGCRVLLLAWVNNFCHGFRDNPRKKWKIDPP